MLIEESVPNDIPEPHSLRVSLIMRWPDVAQACDLDPAQWELQEIAHREEARVARIVASATRIDAAGVSPQSAHRLTVKHQLRPWNPDGFAHQYACHQTAYTSFPASEGFALMKPLFVDPEQQCALFDYAAGRNLNAHLQQLSDDPAGRLYLIEQAGRWLDLLHRSSGPEQGGFNPGYPLRQFARMRQDLDNGDMDVPDRGLFLDGVTKTEQIGATLKGQQSYSSVQHGDFHIGNLIWDGERMTGIDITSQHVTYVGRDICKFLVDVSRRFWKVPEGGQIIAAEVVEAFFAGYTLVGPQDPSVRFFTYFQILESWAQVPKNKQDRTKAKQLLIRQLRPIAKRAFRNP